MAKAPEYRIRHLMEEELLGTGPKEAAPVKPLTTATAPAKRAAKK
ncbi:MAG: hypothetical protein V4696_01405 [Pseudomonadota bacterium]